jgi:hypothetical protein
MNNIVKRIRLSFTLGKITRSKIRSDESLHAVMTDRLTK